MSKRIIPRGVYILVQPDDEQSLENEFGILMPDNTEQEQKAQGEVINVGAKVDDIKKGDKVIYGMYAGEKIKFKNGKKECDFILLHSDDVIGFIEE